MSTRAKRWRPFGGVFGAPEPPRTLRVLTNVRTFRGPLAQELDARCVATSQAGLRGLLGLVVVALRSYRYDVLFLNCPNLEAVILAGLLLLLPGNRCRFVCADVVLQRPRTPLDRAVVRVKRLLLRRVDLFLLVHRDFSAFERYYGITARRVHYVPWKVNGLEHGRAYFDAMEPEEGDYIFSSGVTHRDWRTLAEATAGLSIPLVISLPEESQIRADGLVTTIPNLADFRCPVRLVRNPRDPRWWMTVAAKAKFCVLPISPHSISPSGISTGLALMALGKCVILSEGESTRGIFGPEHVVTVPPGDPQALRAAILSVDQQADLRRRIAEAGRALALSHGDTARLHSDFIRAIQQFVRPKDALTHGSVQDGVRQQVGRSGDLP